MKTLLVLLSVLLCCPVLAQKPGDPGSVADQSPRYGVLNTGPTIKADSSQPVNVMNWLIDENGNLKVSNQVRDLAILLQSTPVDVPDGQSWVSDWIDAARFNTLYVELNTTLRSGQFWRIVEWQWFPDLPDHFISEDLPATSIPVQIKGPRFRVRYQLGGGSTGSVNFAAVYLRTE